MQGKREGGRRPSGGRQEQGAYGPPSGQYYQVCLQRTTALRLSHCRPEVALTPQHGLQHKLHFFVRVQSTLQPSPQQTCQSSLLDTVMAYCSLPMEARALYPAMATPTPPRTSRCRTKGPWGGISRDSTRPANMRYPRSPRGRTGSPSPRAKRFRLHRPPGAAALPTREPPHLRHRLDPLARGRARQAAM